MSYRFVLSGGHFTPAHAFMQECFLHHDEVMLIDRVAPTQVEMINTVALGYIYRTIPIYKFDRHRPWRLLTDLTQGISAITQSYRFIRAFRPHACIVFGGYVSVPVALAAYQQGVPVFLHEQTMNPGLASRLISRISFKNFTALPVPKGLLHGETRCVGNLIRHEFYTPQPTPPWYQSAWTHKPLLYITGGSQGSGFLNQLISSLYDILAKDFIIIHQTGTHSVTPPSHHNILVQAHFSTPEVAWIMQHAECVISRSGANTISEIIASHVPAILIPFPHSVGGEQLLHAQYLMKHQVAVCLEQGTITGELLLSTIHKITRHRSFYHSQYDKFPGLSREPATVYVYDQVVLSVHGK